MLMALALPMMAPAAAAAEDLAVEASEREAAALDSLRLARLHFDRGDFDTAVEKFASILDRPVKLVTRDSLHEGFLYYAFTLFLQGKPDRARDKLQFALQLKPTFALSAVTTRPDLLGFYLDEQAIYRTTNGDEEPLLESLFPELSERPGEGRVIRRRIFFPFLGIGLRQLGHRAGAAVLLVTEVASLSTNVASFVLRLAYFNDRTPNGWKATYAGRTLNYISFGVFWATILIDFVVSIALQRYYRRHPERLRTDGLARARNRAPLRWGAAPEGMALTFW
jgi:tetratricopeptide (TPR) repeat protein